MKSSLATYDLSALTEEERTRLAALVKKAKLTLPRAKPRPVRLSRKEARKIADAFTAAPNSPLVLTRSAERIRVYSLQGYLTLVGVGHGLQRQRRGGAYGSANLVAA